MRQNLFQKARDAMAFAHVPYSKFPVGAAILAGNGEVYSGCNIENVAYPSGWCAETSAISAMVGNGQKSIVEIAVVAEKLVEATPCGGCRQRIAEFGTPDTLIHLCDDQGISQTIRLGDLLPNSFRF